jgi:phytoene desaturase
VARVVVIGAGMSGLATAARLADFGHLVTVFEQADTVGGRIGRHVQEGYAFDTGPTLLTLPAVYRDLFRKTGKPLERVLELVPADPAVRFRFPDGARVDLPSASRAGAARAFDQALGAGSGAAWQSVIEHGRQVWQTLRSPYLTAVPSRRELARLAWPVTRRAVAAGQSLREVAQRLLGDPRLISALECTAPGCDPRRAPGALTAIPYLHETFGRWYVAGGMRRLVDAVHTRALERGAVVRTGCPVAEVLGTAGQAAGVRLAGGEPVPADVVISAVDARHLYRDLLPAARRGRAVRVAPSPSVFTMLLALGDAPELPRHTVLISPDREAELEAVFGPLPTPPVDPTIEIDATDDPAARPAATARPWTVKVTVPTHGPVDWTAPGLADAYADRILATMAARGLDVRAQLDWRVVRTPADLLRATNAPGAWGNSIDGVRSIRRRPGNRTPVRGLFLVGSSTHPGPGLPLVGLSSTVVADLVGRA